jgi:hypothetical protein
MEGEIGDHLPMVLTGLRLECAEPVVDPLFRQVPFALREKDIDLARHASIGGNVDGGRDSAFR